MGKGRVRFSVISEHEQEVVAPADSGFLVASLLGMTNSDFDQRLTTDGYD